LTTGTIFLITVLVALGLKNWTVLVTTRTTDVIWRMSVLHDAINEINAGGLSEFGERYCCHTQFWAYCNTQNTPSLRPCINSHNSI